MRGAVSGKIYHLPRLRPDTRVAALRAYLTKLISFATQTISLTSGLFSDDMQIALDCPGRKAIVRKRRRRQLRAPCLYPGIKKKHVGCHGSKPTAAVRRRVMWVYDPYRITFPRGRFLLGKGEHPVHPLLRKEYEESFRANNPEGYHHDLGAFDVRGFPEGC